MYGTVAGAIDADPLTPGIQTQPGVVTPTGVPQIVGNVYNNQNQCCPWWIWTLLGLLLLLALLAGIYSLFKSKKHGSIDDDEDEDEDEKVERYERTERTVRCSGYTTDDGKCISCPQGSRWNGRTCTYRSGNVRSSTEVTEVTNNTEVAAPAPVTETISTTTTPAPTTETTTTVTSN